MLQGQLGERLDLAVGALGAGGVVKVVEDEQLRAWRDGRLDRFEVEQEVRLAGDEAVGLGHAAQELDLRFVDGEARVRVEHFVAGVHQREQELLDDRLAAGLHGDVLGTIGDAAVGGGDVVGQRLTQLGDAAVGAVPRLAVGQSPVGRLDDVRRRTEVHVAEMEGIDGVALSRPGGALGAHGEGRLGAQAGDPVGDG